MRATSHVFIRQYTAQFKDASALRLFYLKRPMCCNARMTHAAVIMWAAFLMAACDPPEPAHPTPPKPGPTPVVRDTDECGAAYDNLKKLQCVRSDGAPLWVNADGELFDVTCRRVQEDGGVFIDPLCVANAATCKEARACPPSSR